MMIALLLTATSQVHPELPRYQAEIPLEGPLTSVGSDTLNNLLQLWCEELVRLHPAFRPSIEGKG